MKRQQSRAPPAVGIACCAVHAGTTACVVKLCAASLAACALCVRMCSCRVFSRKASQPRPPRCAISHPARYPMVRATCMRWRLNIGRTVVTDGRVRVWLRRHRERCTQQPLAAVGLPLSTHVGLLGVGANMGYSVHSAGATQTTQIGGTHTRVLEYEYHAGTGALTWALLERTDGTRYSENSHGCCTRSDQVLRVLSCSTTGTRVGYLRRPHA
jgi:hypothetical protein